MTEVEVEVASPYRVLVGSGLLERVAAMVAEPAVAVVSDTNVAPHYGTAAHRLLSEAGKRVKLVEVPAGEESKSLQMLGDVLRRLAQAGFGRDCAVLAIGGGVVSDLAGFAAASYLRGVAYYACPTSLLAMVDASVGGKTGVNLPEGKNLVGAFWQPRLVMADVATLATLPERQFREGAVELYKHGLLGEAKLLTALDDREFRRDGDAAILEEYVARSVAVKARVVADDEREQGGRAFLNLGHSLAHALEAVTGHRLSHGEAVAYGLLFSALLGKERGWHDFVGQARRLLTWLEPTPLPSLAFDDLMPYLLRDKKNSAAGQRFVLLEQEATPVLVDDVGEFEQRRAWERLLEVEA
ncbi:MAG: 3-dehydroquinate synthase [Trueperaceae bacterium]